MSKSLLAFVAFLFFTFGSPAFAQDGVGVANATLTFAKPNLELPTNHRPLNLSDYLVVVYLGRTACQGTFSPDDNILVMNLEGDVEKKTLQLPVGNHSVCTYMQIDHVTRVLIPQSYRLVQVVPANSTAKLEPYAPYIDRLPDITSYYSNARLNISETKTDYYLIKTQTDTCPQKTDGTGKIYLSQTVNPFEVSGGTWSFGVYHEVSELVKDPANQGMKIQHKVSHLLKGTCNSYQVLGFNTELVYQPVLPPEILASYVAPVVIVPAYGLTAGMRTDFTSAGFNLRGEWLPRSAPLIVTATFGMLYPELAGDTYPLTFASVGAGYTHWHSLPRHLQINWNAQLQGGLSGLVLQCSPGRYNPNQVYNCSDSLADGGFPLVLTAPWFGPAGDVKVVGQINNLIRPVFAGVDISFAEQMFLTSKNNVAKTASGDVGYVSNQTIWLRSALTISGVMMW